MRYSRPEAALAINKAKEPEIVAPNVAYTLTGQVVSTGLSTRTFASVACRKFINLRDYT